MSRSIQFLCIPLWPVTHGKDLGHLYPVRFNLFISAQLALCEGNVRVLFPPVVSPSCLQVVGLGEEPREHKGVRFLGPSYTSDSHHPGLEDRLQLWPSLTQSTSALCPHLSKERRWPELSRSSCLAFGKPDLCNIWEIGRESQSFP